MCLCLPTLSLKYSKHNSPKLKFYILVLCLKFKGVKMRTLCVNILILLILETYGFEVIYLDYCSHGTVPDPFPINGEKSSGSVSLSKSPENGTWYPSNLNCTVILTAEANHFLLLTFSNVSLRNSSMDNLTIDFNGGKSSIILSGQQVCSNEDCEGLKFESEILSNLTLKFLSSNVTVPDNVTGFRAHYTVYDLVGGDGACKDDMFLCENGHCIWNELQCDGHNNCGDRSDEAKCIIPTPDTVWGIVVIVIAILAVLILVPAFCCLATFGTRNIVKSVTVSNQMPTPLLPTTDCGETSGLLTSSDVVSNCWPGTSYERSNSFNYGTSHLSESSPSTDRKKHPSVTETGEQQGGKFL